jgi:hypothetical protein
MGFLKPAFIEGDPGISEDCAQSLGKVNGFIDALEIQERMSNLAVCKGAEQLAEKPCKGLFLFFWTDGSEKASICIEATLLINFLPTRRGILETANQDDGVIDDSPSVQPAVKIFAEMRALDDFWQRVSVHVLKFKVIVAGWETRVEAHLCEYIHKECRAVGTRARQNEMALLIHR